MDKLEDIIKYLSENLDISIEQTTDFGSIEQITQITVKLELNGKVISESSCDLPEQERW